MEYPEDFTEEDIEGVQYLELLMFHEYRDWNLSRAITKYNMIKDMIRSKTKQKGASFGSYSIRPGMPTRSKRWNYSRTLSMYGFFPFGHPTLGYHKEISEEGRGDFYEPTGHILVGWDISGSNWDWDNADEIMIAPNEIGRVTLRSYTYMDNAILAILMLAFEAKAKNYRMSLAVTPSIDMSDYLKICHIEDKLIGKDDLNNLTGWRTTNEIDKHIFFNNEIDIDKIIDRIAPLAYISKKPASGGEYWNHLTPLLSKIFLSHLDYTVPIVFLITDFGHMGNFLLSAPLFKIVRENRGTIFILHLTQSTPVYQAVVISKTPSIKKTEREIHGATVTLTDSVVDGVLRIRLTCNGKTEVVEFDPSDVPFAPHDALLGEEGKLAVTLESIPEFGSIKITSTLPDSIDRLRNKLGDEFKYVAVTDGQSLPYRILEAYNTGMGLSED